MEFVYNEIPFFPWRGHSLMLYSDYKNEFLKDDTRTNRRIKREIEFMINHISSVN